MKRLLFVLLLMALVSGVGVSMVGAAPFSLSAATSGGKVHVVQPGQTLFSIARWYGVDLWALARYNGILNPNYIYVGQRLMIPTTGTPAPSGRVYVVKPGDTLTRIASIYGVSVWAIAQANGIYNLQTIYIGQRLVIPSTAPAPAPPPAATATPKPSSSGQWKGEYFVGTTPSGGPRFVRYDTAVNFQWDLAAPDPRLPVDEFSVHWTRTFLFKGGLYRFKVRVDDGARVWVDGELILDAWKVQPETDYQVDIVLDPGHHVVALDYFDAQAVATIQFSFSRLGPAPSAAATPTPTPTPTGAAPVGWYGAYYGNPDLVGAPAATRVDPAIGFEWGTGAPIGGVAEDHFSVRWKRTASFFDDNYNFCAMSDDGVRIYLDGHLVLDEWHGSNSVAYCAEADVSGGQHQVTVEYYEDGGNALIYVWWDRH